MNSGNGPEHLLLSVMPQTDLTEAQRRAYFALMHWIESELKKGGDLTSWGVYLITAGPLGHLLRIRLGEQPPAGWVIIGPNCAKTACIRRTQDLQRDPELGPAPNLERELWSPQYASRRVPR